MERGNVQLRVVKLSTVVPAISLLYIVPFLWRSVVRFLFVQHPHLDPLQKKRQKEIDTKEGKERKYKGEGRRGSFLFLCRIHRVM